MGGDQDRPEHGVQFTARRRNKGRGVEKVRELVSPREARHVFFLFPESIFLTLGPQNLSSYRVGGGRVIGCKPEDELDGLEMTINRVDRQSRHAGARQTLLGITAIELAKFDLVLRKCDLPCFLHIGLVDDLVDSLRFRTLVVISRDGLEQGFELEEMVSLEPRDGPIPEYLENQLFLWTSNCPGYRCPSSECPHASE